LAIIAVNTTAAQEVNVKIPKAWMLLLLLPIALSACSQSPKKAETTAPMPAHLTDADGTPVPGSPEPEIVQLKSIEMVEGALHVTVGNIAGDYVLVCNPGANKDAATDNCAAPFPRENYLLFRKSTKWLINGAKEPLTIEFMQDWSVTYNNKENIMLWPAKKSEHEFGRMFWLLSWTARQPIK
jgi:hypothetical protein